MRKPFLIIALILVVLSLSVYGLMTINSKENTNKMTAEIAELKTDSNPVTKNISVAPKREFFFFEYGTRFAPLPKSIINDIKDVSPFLRVRDLEKISRVKSVEIVQIINEDRSDIKLRGNSKDLTEAQTDFIKTAPYSTNFMVSIVYERKEGLGNGLDDFLFTPHYTIAPEIQAQFKEGKETFINLLSNETQFERLGVIEKNLKAGKLYFTVTKEGLIENVELLGSSNYPLIDKKIRRLLESTSGNWMPAKDHNGSVVDQEIVLSFGQLGC